ncbi:MAG: SRPBCC domain-containing protein [Pseudomonadota bacterium]
MTATTALPPAVRHGSFRIEKHYAFTPAQVFGAWTTPEARRAWFVEGPGFDILDYRLDFRTLGHEYCRFRVTGETTEIWNQTVFHEILPDARVVFAYSMGTQAGAFSASLATAELFADGKGGTRLVFNEQIAQLDGKDQVPDREGGTRWLLDRLEQYLQGSLKR